MREGARLLPGDPKQATVIPGCDLHRASSSFALSVLFPLSLISKVGSGALTPLGQYILPFISSISLPDLRHGCQLRYGPPQGAGSGPQAFDAELRARFSSTNITPGDGTCNMVEKKFFKVIANERGVIVVYEQ
ncbi:hypothetical protein K438DRAFT_1072111 [Mycena galopus ATCC 62051]|nr:hypothetical protein K438DRAFT_1072111 [Mycena galopus ATCC 62051]